MLSAARLTAATPALSVTSSAAQLMAAAGSDATANQGVALVSILREDDPIYDAATLAKAASTCNMTAALCEKPSPSIATVSKIRDCLTCKNSCNFAFAAAAQLVRPALELRRWRITGQNCVSILRAIK